MTISKPAYFDSFRCIAGACPDSCCKEWEVMVDEKSAAYYRSLTGPLGDRLRQVLRDEEDCGTLMTIENGRCPMWRQDGLCRIQAELGEEALCQVCTDFPRLRHDYGDFVELGLELSCPEAARIIFSAQSTPFIVEELPGGEKPEYDTEAMASLKASRSSALSLLQTDFPAARRLALLLLYGYQAQAELDGEEALAFDPQKSLDSAADFAKNGDIAAFSQFFQSLEILTPGWKTLLQQALDTPVQDACIPLARYLIERYWLQAVSDYDLACRVKFIVISCLMINALPGSFVENAQLFSKEIENNTDNVEAILDAAYTSTVFTDDKLLGMLLMP